MKYFMHRKGQLQVLSEIDTLFTELEEHIDILRESVNLDEDVKRSMIQLSSSLIIGKTLAGLDKYRTEEQEAVLDQQIIDMTAYRKKKMSASK